MTEVFDYAIVGAGMAGASLAAEIGGQGSVLVLEREDAPGYHSTGRSAAFWEECYGGPDIVPLTIASGNFLRENDFLTQRGALYLARADDEGKIAEFFDMFRESGAHFEKIERNQLDEMVPNLRADWDRAIWQHRCADIDVAGLHAHYLGISRKSGHRTECRAELVGADRRDGAWQLELSDGRRFAARTLVNAAGAWADQVAELAGARPLGIQPFRRTVVQLRVDPSAPADMPLCLDISGGFYFKPDNGRLWLSPHDETPSDPIDAAPEEFDVAVAIDRLQSVSTWKIEAVERKWAGLRSFAPDRRPVYGFDPETEGFFWFAGQGGYGIQTAPAAARLGSQLLLGLPKDAMTLEIPAERYSPGRFA